MTQEPESAASAGAPVSPGPAAVAASPPCAAAPGSRTSLPASSTGVPASGGAHDGAAPVPEPAALSLIPLSTALRLSP
jgi:hypothetical protein